MYIVMYVSCIYVLVQTKSLCVYTKLGPLYPNDPSGETLPVTGWCERLTPPFHSHCSAW